MFTQISSAGIRGMEGFLVSVEADVSNGLPGFSISGQLALEVREAQERVRTALKNSDFQLPAKKITVNLSPAGRRKEGTVFDALFVKMCLEWPAGHDKHEIKNKFSAEYGQSETEAILK